MTPAERWLALPQPARDRLKAAGVTNGEQLAGMGTRELDALPGVGHQTVRAVREQFPAPGGALVAQPHGGALRRGNPGNKGGRGYPNELRRRLTESFIDRVDFAERIIDGEEGTQTVTASCGQCGSSVRVEVPGARVGDRLRAWELLGKFGPGAGHTFSKEEVAALMTELARDLQLRLRDTWGRQRADEFMVELTGSWRDLLRGVRE